MNFWNVLCILILAGGIARPSMLRNRSGKPRSLLRPWTASDMIADAIWTALITVGSIALLCFIFVANR